MHKNLIKLFYGLLYATPVFLLALTACGGGGGSTSSFFSISGQTVNLTSDGLILINSGTAEELGVSGVIGGIANFSFVSSVAAGSSYNISVMTNPSSPAQRCAVTASASSVAMTSDVIDVVVSCDYRTIGGLVKSLYSNFYELEISSNLGEMISVSGVGDVPYAFTKKYADGDFYETKVRAASGVVCSALSLPLTIDDSVSKVIATGTIASNVTVPEITCF